jgi:uncharacterized protein YodC (DUF2158 family)
MTNAVGTFDDTTGFRRGHRVRFANGPVMTVMSFDNDEHGALLLLCGWWRSDYQLESEYFHPDVLIHTDADYGALLTEPAAEDTDGFTEFHSG